MRTTVTLPRTIDVSPTRHGIFYLTATATTYRIDLGASTLFETPIAGTPMAPLSDAFDLLAEFCDALPTLTHEEARALAQAAPRVVRSGGWSRLEDIHQALAIAP
jgi:hypothetical protein